MSSDTSNRFYETLKQLTDGKSDDNPEGKGLNYARYRAVEFLRPEYRSKYKNAVHIGQTLAGIYRVHMVKRLESSFYAFKKSLRTLLRITTDMIKMFEEDKVIIAPDLKVKDLQAKIWSLMRLSSMPLPKDMQLKIFSSPPMLSFLNFSKCSITTVRYWNNSIQIGSKENDDPKFDKFQENLTHNFFDKEINPSGKLVLFSESVDTLNYLYDRLTKGIGRTDVLMVTAANRNRLAQTIKENFDANFDSNSMRYNIIITSDVLAEGVNLHRSNVIVNYDSPWNATRLMQRIGRVNRIGSIAPNIYNYMFYPSQQGDKEIQLYKNALVKLQGFHSAFGEDAQIYSKEEIVKEFQMFDNNVKDSIDKKIALLRKVRELYNNDRKLYHKIKALPMKSRVMRDTGKHSGKSIIFVSSNVKTEFYLATETGVEVIDFLEAVKYLKAKPEEQPVPFSKEEQHYKQVNSALAQYTTEYVEAADTSSINRTDLDKTSLEANKFLRTIKQITTDCELKSKCDVLMGYINEGIYAQLPRYLKALSREYKNDRSKMKQDEYSLQNKISELLGEYQTMDQRTTP